jgi:adenosylhomocysteine nucleosidase
MANAQPLLGIIAALPAEARAAGAREFPAGQAVNVAENVLLIRCGIGRVRAARAARDLTGAGAVAVMSWGTAAAVSPDLDHGDLVLPLEVLSWDGYRFSVDHPWRHRLAKILEFDGGCYAGTVAEADSVLKDGDDKQRLHKLSGALIADMESAAIAEVCHEAGIRLLVVRAVSDRASARIPACALAAVDGDGDVSVARCLGKLVFAPGDWLALLRLARGFREACGSLSRLAQRAGPDFLLSAPGAPEAHPKRPQA